MKLVPHTFARWLAPAVLACAGQANALGMDMPYESFAAAPDVDWIKVCGQWPAPVQPGDGGGMYRIVHATRYAQSFLYLQWIVRDAQTVPPRSTPRALRRSTTTTPPSHSVR